MSELVIVIGTDPDYLQVSYEPRQGWAPEAAEETINAIEAAAALELNDKAGLRLRLLLDELDALVARRDTKASEEPERAHEPAGVRCEEVTTWAGAYECYVAGGDRMAIRGADVPWTWPGWERLLETSTLCRIRRDGEVVGWLLVRWKLQDGAPVGECWYHVKARQERPVAWALLEGFRQFRRRYPHHGLVAYIGTSRRDLQRLARAAGFRQESPTRWCHE